MSTMNLTLKELERIVNPLSHMEQLIECVNDAKFFASNFYKRYSNDAFDFVQFEPYQHQLDLLELMQTQQLLCINSSRNVGLTTALQAFIAWKLLVSPNQTIVLVGKHSNQMTAMLRELTEYICDDDNFSIDAKFDSSGISCSNGAHLVTTTIKNIHNVRGMTISTLIFERQFGDEDVWTNGLQGIIPAIPSTGQIIEIANIHVGSLIEGMYECKVPWNVVPGRDEDFKQQMINRIGPEAWLLEYGD